MSDPTYAEAPVDAHAARLADLRAFAASEGEACARGDYDPEYCDGWLAGLGEAINRMTPPDPLGRMTHGAVAVALPHDTPEGIPDDA